MSEYSIKCVEISAHVGEFSGGHGGELASLVCITVSSLAIAALRNTELLVAVFDCHVTQLQYSVHCSHIPVQHTGAIADLEQPCHYPDVISSLTVSFPSIPTRLPVFAPHSVMGGVYKNSWRVKKPFQHKRFSPLDKIKGGHLVMQPSCDAC